MKAFVFSIGEATTDLCASQMEKYGFDVEVWQNDSPLWQKLERLYQFDEDVVRIDADIIPNEEVKSLVDQAEDLKDQGYYWWCTKGWDWYANRVGSVSIHYMTRQALEIGRSHANEMKSQIRPETYIWRLPELHNPRRCHHIDVVAGIHGYGQKLHRDRIKYMKHMRDQDYDWDLVKRIEEL